MSDLKVNTDRVLNSANNLAVINNKIRNSFGNVEKAVNQLNNAWGGSAAENAMTKFNSIKSSFCDERYEVLDGYVRFLQSQAGEGYVETETVNKSLADAFK